MGKVMQVGLSLLAASFVAGAIILILVTANEAAESSNEAANSGSIYSHYMDTAQKRASTLHY